MDFSYCLLLIEVILEIREVCMDSGSFLSNHIGTIVNAAVAICTLYMAYATHRMAMVTKQTLDEQSKPYVIMYTEQRKNSPQMLQLVIENVGNSPAYDIKFEIPDDFYMHMYGTPIIPHALQYGLSQLVPKQRICYDWGRYCDLKKYEDRLLTIEISFLKNKNDNDVSKNTSINVLDVKDFLSVSAYKTIGMLHIEKLEKININLLDLKNIIDRKLTPQSPEDSYMLAYATWRLLDKKIRLEDVESYGRGSGLTKDQLQNAEIRVLHLLKEYRPDLITKGDEDFLSFFSSRA